MSLSDYQALGLVELLDVELARALGRLAADPSPQVELAIALTSRNVRRGHSCFPVGMSAEEVWPNESAQPGSPKGVHSFSMPPVGSTCVATGSSNRTSPRSSQRGPPCPPSSRMTRPGSKRVSANCFPAIRIRCNAARPETRFAIGSLFFAAGRAPARRRRWRPS